MNRNKKISQNKTGRAIALMTAGVMLAQPLSIFAAEAGTGTETAKEETVYVKTDAAGAPEEVIVSDWLKNMTGASILEDYSDLTDIENVKGEETFSKNGNKMVWNAGGSDIYYQGTVKKELPVSVKVTYYLDGREIMPEQLAGKSGHVKICYTYENHAKSGEVYTPFVMVTGMVLPEETFSRVEIKNGKLVSDGEKDIVIGVGLPGLTDSLKLADTELFSDMEIPESFEVEADVTDFKLTMAMTVATPLNMEDLNLEDIDSMDDLRDSVNELVDASTQLVDGSGTLADGVQTLKDSCVELTDGMDLVDKNMGTLAEGIGTWNSKKGELLEGVAVLAEGLQSLEANKESLLQGVHDLAEGSGSVRDGAGKIKDGNAQLAQNSRLLYAGAQELAAGSGSVQLQTGAKNLTDGSAVLKNGVAQYTAAAESLATGIDSYIDSVNTYVQTVNRTFESILKSQGMGNQNAGTSASDTGINTKSETVTTIDADAVSDMQTVLNKLREVKGEISSADSKEDLLRLYASYDSYMAELDECISLMNQALDGVEEEKMETAATVNETSGSGNTASSDGQDAMSDSIQKLMQAGTALTPDGNENVKAMQNGARALVAGADEDQTMGDTLNAGAATVAAGADTLYGGMTQLFAGAGELEQNLSVFSAAADQLAEGSETLYAGSETLYAGAGTLESEVGVLAGGISQLAAGGSELQSGTAVLAGGVTVLADGSLQLKAGTAKLAAGGSQLNSGVAQLKDGADRLRDGMKEFDEEGVGKIADLLEVEVQDMVDRLMEVKDAGEAYKFFSDSGDGMDGSVKFVIETGSIG